MIWTEGSARGNSRNTIIEERFDRFCEGLMKNPPFELTNQIVSDVAEIAELVGRLTSTVITLWAVRRSSIE